MENRIKEIKCDLRMDRTSCESFDANPLRVLLALAAAVLPQAFQQKLPEAISFGNSPKCQLVPLALPTPMTTFPTSLLRKTSPPRKTPSSVTRHQIRIPDCSIII